MDDLISKLSDLRSQYNCFDESEREAYDTLSEAIKVLSAQPERPEQPESAKEYCAECDHIEMCQWYPYEGCEFRSLPSAQPEIIRCKDCLMHGVCRFEQGLGLDGYCSQAERRTDED